jgi:hypothetical protein
MVHARPDKKQDLISKTTRLNGDGAVTQTVELQSIKHKPLSSNHCITQKRWKKKKEGKLS